MSRYKYLLIPIALFIMLFIPYLYVIPSNDGNLEFDFANSWLMGDHRLHLLSLHPPLKLMIFSLFFKLFGYNSVGYIGLLFGIIGIIAIYFVAKKLFDKKVALLSSVLLATSGLYISVGLFGIHDFLMTVFILVAFAFYLNSRYKLYALFICIAILTKETAIFFAVSILLSDIVIKKNVSFSLFVPIVILAWYVEFLHFSGYHLWNDWNFSKTAHNGSAFTMMYNVVTLQIFNKYALENMLHLFVFNFNWIYWIFVIVSFFYIKKAEMKKHLIPIGIFASIFIVLVLTFQTFTINRYTLALMPFVYLFASYAVFKFKYPSIFISLLVITSLVSLFYSVDPVSNLIWNKTPILSEKFYLNKPLDGDDGITYNMQYLNLMKERTVLLEKGDCKLPAIIHDNTVTLFLFSINTCK